MANALGTGTHKRKESYANEVLAIARAETNIYEDFSTDYEKDEVTGQINGTLQYKSPVFLKYLIKPR